jgi:hypothetical protein
MTEIWQAGKTYVPGALARPSSGPAMVQTVPTNPNFEGSLAGWTVQGAAGWSYVTDKVYDGVGSAKYAGSGISALVNNIRAPVAPGQSITAFCVISLDHIASKISAGRIQIYWFDATNTFLSATDAAVISKNNSGNWQQSLIAGTAPANAAFASIAISANADAASFVRVDGVGWYYTYGGPPNGLAYKAVQASPGKSGATEPTWPPTLGTTVVDNEVTWEAVIASQIVYTARPINRSGAIEPAWPTSTGSLVHDGTIDWQAITPQVTDVNCPQTKIVAIAASKVYGADKDIIRYCSTVNPLDWTTPDDAGYLPYGLQTYGSNPVAAMNLYRSNLAAFNAEGMQLWQVDEDPAQTALLDALPVGSTQNLALSPVANDLIFLSSQGVRSIGVTSSSTNLQAGDIGMPIDPLIKAAVAAAPEAPIATYVPSLGQYWLAIADAETPGPTISGALGNGSVGQVVDFHYTITSTGSHTAQIISGSLPNGLVMDTTGHVTGTRISVDEETFVVRVTDASGRTVSKTDTSKTGSATYEQTILADDPHLFWPMGDGDNTCRELIQGLDGTFMGTTFQTNVASILGSGEGSASRFISTDARVDLPISTLLNVLATPFTIEWWMQLVQIPDNGEGIDVIGSSNANSVEAIAGRDGFIKLHRLNIGTGNLDSPTGQFAALEKVFFCVVCDVTEKRLYKNGDLVWTDAGPLDSALPVGASIFKLCGAQSGTTSPPDRLFQNIAVYLSALSPARITAHYEAGS